jgi:hypothetical protein
MRATKYGRTIRYRERTRCRNLHALTPGFADNPRYTMTPGATLFPEPAPPCQLGRIPDHTRQPWSQIVESPSEPKPFQVNNLHQQPVDHWLSIYNQTHYNQIYVGRPRKFLRRCLCPLLLPRSAVLGGLGQRFLAVEGTGDLEVHDYFPIRL